MRTSNGLYRDSQARALALITEVAAIGGLRGLPELTWRIGLTGAVGEPTPLTTADALGELEAWAAALGKTTRLTARGTRTVVDLRDGVFIAVDHDPRMDDNAAVGS